MSVSKRSAISVTCAAMAAGCAARAPIVLQAENATLRDLHLAADGDCFEGRGYVEGFLSDRGEMIFNFDVPHAGVYDVQIRYRANESKVYAFVLNGVGSDGVLPKSDDRFATCDAGKVELKRGGNRITLGKGWGHYAIDGLRLIPNAPYTPGQRVAATLANPNATAEARQLISTLTRAYGTGTFSGVMSDADAAYVREIANVTPTIMGGDLMEYSPSRRAHGADPHGETERLIAAHRAGRIVTLCWHWNAPSGLIDQKEFVDPSGNTVDASWFFGFYARATTFDVSNAVNDAHSAEHALLLRDIDAIAVELKKLQAADVPVLWRPLHEADGRWFWWGTGGAATYQKLWRLLYERLTVTHRLDNLIWVYTWNDDAWYPGDDVVDVIGIDAYPTLVNDTLSPIWGRALRRFDGKKLIALSEFGGVPDVDRMARLGIRWSYFTSWTGELGPRKMPRGDLVRIYHSAALSRP